MSRVSKGKGKFANKTETALGNKSLLSRQARRHGSISRAQHHPAGGGIEQHGQRQQLHLREAWLGRLARLHLRLPPFLRPPDGAPHRARKSEPLGGIQAKIVARLRDQATAAITGGVSGVLVLLTVYKVVSSRESVLAESRKEQQRQVMERKARLANTRRSLAGPLRSAARDLQTRVREILLPTPPTGEPRHNYFASHYLEDPEESVNTTLYRLCRYLFWVEQLQRGAHADGELALDDAWQVAVDVRLERVRQALASSDELVDATRARERLYDVIDAAVRREAERKRREASERRKSADADEKASRRRTKEGAFSAEEERRVRGEERATRSKTSPRPRPRCGSRAARSQRPPRGTARDPAPRAKMTLSKRRLSPRRRPPRGGPPRAGCSFARPR